MDKIIAFAKYIIENYGLAAGVMLAATIGLGYMVLLFIKSFIRDREKQEENETNVQAELLKQYGTLMTNHCQHLGESLKLQNEIASHLMAQTEVLKSHVEAVKMEHNKQLENEQGIGNTLSRIEGRMDGLRRRGG